MGHAYERASAMVEKSPQYLPVPAYVMKSRMCVLRNDNRSQHSSRRKQGHNIGNIHEADDQIGTGGDEGLAQGANTVEPPDSAVKKILDGAAHHSELAQADGWMQSIGRDIVLTKRDERNIISLLGPRTGQDRCC